MSRIHLVLVLLGLSACPKPMVTGEDPADEPPGEPAVVPGGAVDPASPTPEPAPSPPTTAEGCLTHDDCDEGICEGLGCGDDQPGTCAAPDRMCTRDYRPYCGCDGVTFRSSGSCPGRRYASKGECSTPAPSPTPGAGADGSACRSGHECTSGVCEGKGCGDDSPGECKPVSRPCTRDARTYCGCDGQTFIDSGTCPGRRFAHYGECTSGA